MTSPPSAPVSPPAGGSESPSADGGEPAVAPSEVGHPVAPRLGDVHADVLVETQRARAGVGRELADRGAVDAGALEGVDEQGARQPEPALVTPDRDGVDVAGVAGEDRVA